MLKTHGRKGLQRGLVVPLIPNVLHYLILLGWFLCVLQNSNALTCVLHWGFLSLSSFHSPISSLHFFPCPVYKPFLAHIFSPLTCLPPFKFLWQNLSHSAFSGLYTNSVFVTELLDTLQGRPGTIQIQDCSFHRDLSTLLGGAQFCNNSLPHSL